MNVHPVLSGRSPHWHEAGHAVIASALGRRVELVTIERQGRFWGYCYSVPAGSPPITEDAVRADAALVSRWSGPVRRPSPPRGTTAEGEILIALAGFAAEKIATGREDKQAAGDDFARVWGLLVETLPPEQLQSRIVPEFKAALGRTETLLRHRWREVEAIAQALQQHRTLTGEHVRSLLSTRVYQ